ncbi:Predicted arabinose efflux permease, MFS family [Rhodococcus rhodochrous J3]|uniref:Predicted arabinose efflux permease, MFS family n=1 Tax=Rhodococcus rhodochrous J3 TaxID=903528 RepID=A0ABY1MBD2_RHORH|nr:MFS transporter [Rhodococcus rhodochrous]MBF4480655.1 MFS transporter [Rhodococcus rhodochrous]MCB8911354.1 MFS transporter [Rhodococcus rhodochrous]MDO1483761.1 MFS transporter [Rhodococcus rhodochrous]SMG27881.1 Predicted arabinose efflux permease, MFS family [Rhodococcus rhodochrous J3]SNV08235.1 mfs transporter [Rhodococcus rhodochrous]
MTVLADIRGQTFAALRGPNFRLYISGQAVSLIGTWMQTVAQSWLVLQLTGSATAIGIVLALQTVPMLLLGPYGGVVADRSDKRRLMIGLQTLMGVQALILGLLVVTDTVALWHVYVLAVALGLNQCFENPARQSFMLELVGPEDLRNAVSLQSVLASCSRMIGPAVAGLVIAAGGLGVCFLLNAASFVAVVTSLLRLDVSRLQRSPAAARAKGQLREGFAYVRSTSDLAVPLLMMALVGCLAFEFQVVLPVLADHTFAAGAGAYGFLTAAMGAGSVVGGLAVATWGRTGTRPLILTSLAFGIAMAVAAAAPNLTTLIVLMVIVGALSVTFTSTTNSSLQLAAAPMMRGRVMALWSVAFLGSTAIGGPIAGWVCEQWGGRAGLLLGAVACLVAAAMGVVALRRRTTTPAEPAGVTG